MLTAINKVNFLTLSYGKESKRKARYLSVREKYCGYADGRETEREGEEGIKESGETLI
jgi:hypothetical protein